MGRVFTDKVSGRDTAGPELTELSRFARMGHRGGAQHGPTGPELDDVCALAKPNPERGPGRVRQRELGCPRVRIPLWPTLSVMGALADSNVPSSENARGRV